MLEILELATLRPWHHVRMASRRDGCREIFRLSPSIGTLFPPIGAECGVEQIKYKPENAA